MSLGYTTSQPLFERLELYGIVLDDHRAQDLGSFWNPTGATNCVGWYVPSDDIVDVETLTHNME